MTINARAQEEALNWFTRLRDPEATEADWRAFTDWAAASEAHGAAYDALERLWVDLDQVEAASLQAPIRPANDDARPRRGRRWLYPAAGLAASAVLAVGLWSYMIGPEQIYRTTDAPRVVRLDDGSRVQLNRHSEMRVRLAGARRRVALADGEAAFDVAHDAGRPFVVEADGREVRVLGTAFNVVNHDDAFSVAVERGVVSVRTRSTAKPTRLTAGGRIRQAGEAAPRIDVLNPSAVATWRSGVLVYREAALDEVAQDLSRYFGKPVTVSAALQGVRFTGALRIADEGAMLDQLSDFIPVSVEPGRADVRLTLRGEG